MLKVGDEVKIHINLGTLSIWSKEAVYVKDLLRQNGEKGTIKKIEHIDTLGLISQEKAIAYFIKTENDEEWWYTEDMLLYPGKSIAAPVIRNE